MIFALFLADSRVEAVELYHITDIGILAGGSESSAVALSSNGMVAGIADNSSGVQTVFVWSSAGGLRDTGITGGIDNGQLGINASGQVVGAGVNNGAFSWTSTGGLQTISIPYSNSIALPVGVNDGGQIAVGAVTDPPGSGQYEHTFIVTSGGATQDLGGIGLGAQGNLADPTPNAINTNGQIAGGLFDFSGPGQAFRWTSGGGFQELGTLPGDSFSNGLAISSNGQVAGLSQNSSTYQAFLWTSGGGMQGLGYLPGDTYSEARGVNASGLVVGVSFAPGSLHAMLWSASSGMQNLNSLLDSSGAGWNLQGAAAINDAGQITGYGLIDGQQHAFLLTPVPEPSSFVLFACASMGAAGIYWRRWWSHRPKAG